MNESVKHSRRDSLAVVVTDEVAVVLAVLDAVALTVEVAVDVWVLNAQVRKGPDWYASIASFSANVPAQLGIKCFTIPLAVQPNDAAGTFSRLNTLTAVFIASTASSHSLFLTCSNGVDASRTTLQSNSNTRELHVSIRSRSLYIKGAHRNSIG